MYVCVRMKEKKRQKASDEKIVCKQRLNIGERSKGSEPAEQLPRPLFPDDDALFYLTLAHDGAHTRTVVRQRQV
jgi:hypothetical protein